MRLRRLAALAVVAIVSASCTADESVRESGVVRHPDDVGIATDVTLDRIQIDRERTYDMHESVESFATRSHHITPLLSWEGKYVHIGLDDKDRVLWIAGIGLVSGKPPRVTYSGVFQSFDADKREATFEDGTVLKLGPDVEAPEEGDEIVVQIDANRDVVVSAA
jgi:hypothetical protein